MQVALVGYGAMNKLVEEELVSRGHTISGIVALDQLSNLNEITKPFDLIIDGHRSNESFSSFYDFTLHGGHIPVLGRGVFDVVGPVGKHLVSLDNTCFLDRPLPLAGNHDAVRVLALLGNADGIVVIVIDTLHVWLHLGTEDERALLEVETGGLGKGNLDGTDRVCITASIGHLPDINAKHFV